MPRRPPATSPAIVSLARTPIGRAGRGALRGERPDDLAAFAIRTALDAVPALPPETIEDVIVGCAVPEGMQGMNIGRRAGLLAGLPERVPGVTVNRFCASSVQALRMAAHAIAAGEGQAFVVGGVESVSQVPGLPRDDDEAHPRLTTRAGDGVANVYISMGETAENVAEQCGVGREEMDAFAQQSHDRALAAQRSGFLGREISPYVTRDGTIVDRDEGPRPESSLESLAQLEPRFRSGGSVTAGNSCPMNDGAAALVVVGEQRAAELGLAPRAWILGSAASGVAPEIMGLGPIEAIELVLGRESLTIDDIDLIEINEAFAAQVIPVARAVGIDPFDGRLNAHGGAIALGHPYGMSGARLVGTLVHGLEETGGRFGLAAMCVAGGQGMAMLIERAAA